MTTYKNVFIGFGKGGKTLAKTLAKYGEEVLMIEESKQMYGGLVSISGAFHRNR